MRLDHLLSKESHSGGAPTLHCCEGVGSLTESHCRPRVWVGCDWVEHKERRIWLGTLLGPEGTPCEGVFFLAAGGLGFLTSPVVGVVVARVAVWLWVECCIVDASILLWSSCEEHMVDAWASGADEGRGRPR